MPNSREESLDEDVVFLPVSESSPQFIYCEKERRAVERLLSSGPEAFYSSIGTELPGCFLSPEEVCQISSWAQDYRFKPPLEATQSSTPLEDFSSTYFPPNSDIPTPDLELGWPEKDPWPVKGNVTVHTNPPAEGDPPIREIIRRHLQQASKVIAIVTDRLTDCAVIGDLHSAASRGVAIYIILNERSIQETFTLRKLRHPNMRVRVIGGKTFCSRMGRMVAGEMKVNFLLVDLKTVVHGSYSLTWTDAHLHRQMITVLNGPVVDSFDQEFRILFAASLPVPDTCTMAGSPTEVSQQMKNITDLRFHKHLPLELEISSPPSPPFDAHLDWEAMGVIHIDACIPDTPLGHPEETALTQSPVQKTTLFDKIPPVLENSAESRNQFIKLKQVKGNTSPVTNYVPDKPAAFNNAPPLLNNMTAPEKNKREEAFTVKNLARRRSLEKNIHLEDRLTKRSEERPVEQNHSKTLLSPTRREHSKTILEEELSMYENRQIMESAWSSRKPLILKLPQSESFSSLNDLMKRIQPQESSLGQLHGGSRGAVSELSQSMMDLSVHKPDKSPIPVPRFQASCFDPDALTSTIALMKKRNEDLKPSLYRTPKTFVPRERPRSSTYGLDWRRPLLERPEDLKMGVKK
ncbi:protein FAM83A isoform X3 [Takifugu flavidus]|uniref:protein FAM83A isoform X3 n=1 Tax=Takifugu flavidus TaxID=433684 RepID=UPI0025445E3D|nr:protein FAM83A isoform X3 [Takifugu flavidus]